MLIIIDGKYIQQHGISVTADTGVITVVFDEGNIAGTTMTFTPPLSLVNNEQVILWKCGGTINTKYLPTSCQ